MSGLVRLVSLERKVVEARQMGRGVPKCEADPDCEICHGAGYDKRGGVAPFPYCECRYRVGDQDESAV